jgi:hypothetical protein
VELWHCSASDPPHVEVWVAVGFEWVYGHQVRTTAEAGPRFSPVNAYLQTDPQSFGHYRRDTPWPPEQLQRSGAQGAHSGEERRDAEEDQWEYVSVLALWLLGAGLLV